MKKMFSKVIGYILPVLILIAVIYVHNSRINEKDKVIKKYSEQLNELSLITNKYDVVFNNFKFKMENMKDRNKVEKEVKKSISIIGSVNEEYEAYLKKYEPYLKRSRD